MTTIMLAGIFVGTILFGMGIASIIIASIEYFHLTTSKGFIKRYIENAQKLSQVKVGEPDPWGANFWEVTKFECFMLRIAGLDLLLFPILILILVVLLLKLLLSSIIGWIIIGSIIGLIVGIKLLIVLSIKCLGWIGTFNNADNKVVKVCKGLKKLANNT